MQNFSGKILYTVHTWTVLKIWRTGRNIGPIMRICKTSIALKQVISSFPDIPLELNGSSMTWISTSNANCSLWVSLLILPSISDMYTVALLYAWLSLASLNKSPNFALICGNEKIKDDLKKRWLDYGFFLASIIVKCYITFYRNLLKVNHFWTIEYLYNATKSESSDFKKVAIFFHNNIKVKKFINILSLFIIVLEHI